MSMGRFESEYSTKCLGYKRNLLKLPSPSWMNTNYWSVLESWIISLYTCGEAARYFRVKKPLGFISDNGHIHVLLVLTTYSLSFVICVWSWLMTFYIILFFTFLSVACFEGDFRVIRKPSVIWRVSDSWRSIKTIPTDWNTTWITQRFIYLAFI